MNRREMLKTSMAAGVGLCLAERAVRAAREARTPVIDCHAHAGTAQEMPVPWRSFGDPAELLRNMEKAGIDQSVIFPMSDPNRHHLFEEANKEIAALCARHPGKFIGYAKHNSLAEKGRIREMLRREVLELGLRGYKMPPPGAHA